MQRGGKGLQVLQAGVLGAYAFGDCSALADISIGSGVSEIQVAAFYGTQLWNSYAEGTVVYVDGWAVDYKEFTTEPAEVPTVGVDDGTIGIGDQAFVSCSAFDTIILPDTVRYIGSYGFGYCTNLVGIVIGTGLEVIGGNVTLKGASGVGTITGVTGEYTITVNDASKDVLVFSFIGLKTQEVPVKGRQQINVTLQADNQLLEEVVVVGYATMKRKDLTGSVASVKSEELTKMPTSDATQALAGRMAGVQVIQSDGQPGSDVSVRVRGGISITQDNEPLYVIDGFPTEDGMSNLDPADIESIDVLKDASATAIYGARGANGVVLVTTKSGSSQKEGKGTLSFDFYLGFRKLANRLHTLSVEEYVLADYERTLGNASSSPEESVRAWQNRYGSFLEIHDNYKDRAGVDWLDETMGRTTLTQNYRIAFSGGSDAVKYNISYNYNKVFRH